MEATDSVIKAAGPMSPSENPVDTLRVHHLFDTGFVFPPRYEASMPYAYDNFYRDDTLFRKAYGNGLLEQEHPCIESWVLSESFPHPAKWLRAGLTREEIETSLGEPTMRSPLQIRYRWHSRAAENGGDSQESMRFYFENDSLYAVLLQRSKPCF
jgi:hypothetical protein